MKNMLTFLLLKEKYQNSNIMIDSKCFLLGELFLNHLRTVVNCFISKLDRSPHNECSFFFLWRMETHTLCFRKFLSISCWWFCFSLSESLWPRCYASVTGFVVVCFCLFLPFPYIFLAIFHFLLYFLGMYSLHPACWIFFFK